MFSIPFFWDRDDSYPPHVYITTSSSQPILTSLILTHTGYEVSTSVSKSTPADIRLSLDVIKEDVRIRALWEAGEKTNKTVIVRSQGQVSVYAINNEHQLGDGYVVYPSSLVGNEYYLAGYKSDCTSHFFFSISSLYDNTQIHVTVKDWQWPRIITLMQYESYRFDSWTDDLSGAFVQSDKPFAVIVGGVTEIPKDVDCSFVNSAIVEQLVSSNHWSTTYILTPFRTVSSGYIYRVYSMNIDTTLSISNKIDTVQLGAESFYEGDVTEDVLVKISADHPVMVAQYMKSNANEGFTEPYSRGTPSMVIVPPLTSFTRNTVTFIVIECTFYYEYYINVITECANIGGLLFDNSILNREWDHLASDDNVMCCVRARVAPGQHTISHTDPMKTFSVLIYALTNWCCYAYAYMASLFYSEGKM